MDAKDLKVSFGGVECKTTSSARVQFDSGNCCWTFNVPAPMPPGTPDYFEDVGDGDSKP